MKKWVVFLIGLVAGCVLAVLVFVAIGEPTATKDTSAEEKANSIPGLNLFDQPGDEFSAVSFEVKYVLESNIALACSIEYGETDYYGLNILDVLIIGDENTHFYDDLIVDVKSGQVARLVGTYKHGYKTFPVIKILEK